VLLTNPLRQLIRDRTRAKLLLALKQL
jgi:hypothetical protein